MTAHLEHTAPAAFQDGTDARWMTCDKSGGMFKAHLDRDTDCPHCDGVATVAAPVAKQSMQLEMFA